MAKKQRIVLANSSLLVRDLLKKVIGKKPGLEIVSNVEDYTELPEILETTEADWGIILLPPNGEVPEIINQVIEEQTSMRFLLMDVDGSHVRMIYRKPQEVPLDEQNLQDILELLRKDRIERRYA